MSSKRGARETCTLTELARLAGRSTKVVKGWLRESGVPVFGQSTGRYFVVDHLSARRPEIYRIFERRAEAKARGERAPSRVDPTALDDEAA